MWIRTFGSKDIDAISALLGKTWHATYDEIYGVERVNEITAEWHNPSALAMQVRMINCECLVADNGEKIVGMAYGREDDPGTVKLQQLYVLPEFHGQGVGKLLLKEIEDSFFDAKQFVLEVEEKNNHAIGFYEKHDYVKSGTVDNCGREDSGIPALVFIKDRGF